jgi:hypothetical protein
MWRGLDVATQGITWFLDARLREHESGSAPVPDLSDGKTLLIVSDYSGEQKRSPFLCLTYFVTNNVEALKWDQLRIKIRAEFQLEDRRMAYSKLNDARRAAAAYPVARCLNELRGVVFNVLIDKRLRTVFKAPIDTSRKVGGRDTKHWRSKALERMGRVTQLAAFFAAGTSAPRQNIVWITDEDELAPDVNRFQQVTTAFANALFGYLPHACGNVRFGTTASDTGLLELEDLAAIPDLFAGMLADVAMASPAIRQGSARLSPRPIPEKAESLGGALLAPSATMRKFIFLIQPREASENFYVSEIAPKLDERSLVP